MKKKKPVSKKTERKNTTQKGNLIQKMLREGEYLIQGKQGDPEVVLNRAECSVPFLCGK